MPKSKGHRLRRIPMSEVLAISVRTGFHELIGCYGNSASSDYPTANCYGNCPCWSGTDAHDCQRGTCPTTNGGTCSSKWDCGSHTYAATCQANTRTKNAPCDTAYGCANSTN